MEGGGDCKATCTTGTKRKYMSSDSSCYDDIDGHRSKRSKTWSSSDSSSSESAAVTGRLSLSSSLSSSSKVTTMDDLPDNLLVEIFCRIPCCKSVCQCKCVRKRWGALISAPYFIPRFLRVQKDHKQMPVRGTFISDTGEEFLNRMTSSTTKPLAQLFNKLVSTHGLKQEPVVVGTYNDLVLCCASTFDQRDYYICNPYTTQWVALPPPPQVHYFVAVGFMCDVPYYSTKKDKAGEGYGIQLNHGFRYRVLRLVMGDEEELAANFKVEVYASETGQWMETIVSSSSVYGCEYGCIDFFRSITYNGMIYWEGFPVDFSHDSGSFLIGLDPFKINNSTSTGDDDIYKCRFIQFEGREGSILNCSGVARGCLRMWVFTRDDNSKKLCVRVWDLNEGDGQVGRLAIHGGDHVKIDLLTTMRVHLLDGIELLPGQMGLLLGSDLSNEDILYLRVGSKIIEYNVRTNEWSILKGWRYGDRTQPYYPIVLPLWPTPVPELPQNCCTTNNARPVD